MYEYKGNDSIFESYRKYPSVFHIIRGTLGTTHSVDESRFWNWKLEGQDFFEDLYN